jgi:EAL domain-containing protein (putative c-di-GMP-specific phosphodiesterase class I)
VAEYVENEAILKRVTALGIDFAQGYHFGRPQPVDKVLGNSPDS